jgi:peroxiredoxin
MAGESIQQLTAGDEAPSVELTGTDERSYTLGDFEDNEALLVVFTCNHCPYAKAKHPLLNEIAAEHDDVAVVGINPNDPEEYPEDSFESMQAVVEDGEIAYDAYLFDETQDVATRYSAVCTPDPFLFERDGDTFRLAYHGRLDDALNPDDDPSRYHIREAIDAVLEGEPVDLAFEPSRGCTIKWREGNKPDYWDRI